MRLELSLKLAAAFAVALYAYRSFRARTVERAFEAKYANRRNAEGVIKGAESYALHAAGDHAIVLLHGYNDSPQSMRSPASAFNAAGWTVYVPLLPGHGRSLQAFAGSGADAWIDAARSALTEARARHRRVAVGGLSMGGALAAIVAAEQPEIITAALFAPFLVHSRRLGAIAALWPLLSLGVKYLTGGSTARSIRDPAAREAFIAYGCSTPRLMREVQRVAELARYALPSVLQPVFIAQSSDDYRIPATEAQVAFDLLGSTDKHLHWTTGNGHVITVDYGHEELSAEAARWVSSRLPAS